MKLVTKAFRVQWNWYKTYECQKKTENASISPSHTWTLCTSSSILEICQCSYESLGEWWWIWVQKIYKPIKRSHMHVFTIKVNRAWRGIYHFGPLEAENVTSRDLWYIEENASFYVKSCVGRLTSFLVYEESVRWVIVKGKFRRRADGWKGIVNWSFKKWSELNHETKNFRDQGKFPYDKIHNSLPPPPPKKKKKK